MGIVAQVPGVILCVALMACSGAVPSGAGKPSAATPADSTQSGFDTLEGIVAGASREGLLRASWSPDTLGGAQGFQLIGDTLNEKYGINLRYEWAPGPTMGTMQSKILQELAAGQPASTDVYVGTDQHFPLLQQNRALKALNWSGLSEGRITADTAAEGGVGIKLGSRFVGVPYNTNLVKGDDIPRQLNDVLNPQWKGKIASTASAAMLPILASPKLLGPTKTDEFMTQFVPAVGGLMRCGEEQRVASGEFTMMVLSCGADPSVELQRKGAPIGHAILTDAAIINIDRLGIPENSSHPYGAALLMLYLSSVEGQQLVYQLQHIDLHYYPETHQHQALVDLESKGIKPLAATTENLADVDVKGLAEKYAQMLATATGR
jgi:ABC-type Fe3+ transport system substrate-binding protein